MAKKTNPLVIIGSIVVIIFLLAKTGGFIGAVFSETILFKGNNYGVEGSNVNSCSYTSTISSSESSISGSISGGACGGSNQRQVVSQDLNLNVKSFKVLFTGTISGSGREDGWANADISVQLTDGINNVNLASRSLQSRRGTYTLSNIIYEKVSNADALVVGEGTKDISKLDSSKPWHLVIVAGIDNRNPADMVSSASFTYAGVTDIVTEEISRQAQIINLPIPLIQGSIQPSKSFSWSNKIDVSQVISGSSMDLIYRIKASDASNGLEPIYKEYDFKFERQ